MSRLAWTLRHRATALALWAGAALIGAALGLHWFGVRPLEQTLATLQARQDGARQVVLDRLNQEMARHESPQAQLAGFYRHFADAEVLTDRLAKVHTIAKSLGLEIRHADYRLSSPTDNRLDRYQMIMPIQGSYPTIRVFVTAVLRDQPAVSLDQIQYERKDIGEADVQAQIRFTFFVAKP